MIPFTLACAARLQAASFSLDRVAQINYDFGGMRMPQWSGGALVNFVNNQTASPILLSFDDQGRQLHALPFMIPDSDTVDLDDIARSPEGGWAVCGKAFDHAGRGTGFIAVISPSGDQVTVARLYPYYPSLVAIGSDGTIWTAGLEVVNGRENGPGVNLEHGVIRHFDRVGKPLGSFIPRSSLSSRFMVLNGLLRSANGRIGWYTGPTFGPGSEYFEILSDGAVRKYPSIDLNKHERVSGLALTEDGRAYVTTSDNSDRTWHLLSIAASDQQWRTEALPAPLSRVALYGGEGKRLVFFTDDRFKLTFVNLQ